MKITYIDGGCYKITADKDDLDMSFRAENIEAAREYYLHMIEVKFYDAVNMGLIDPDVMDREEIPFQ